VTNWYQLNVTQKRKAEEKAAAQKQAELNAVAVQINNDIRKAEGAADEIHF
jgi:molybdopterin-biosynthesis enzyme MoeA-like protein